MVPSQSLIGFLESVVYGKRKDPLAVGTRAMLTGWSLAYQAGLKLYMLPFETGVRKKHSLPAPVISIGNVTVGGTGKSPTVQYVCSGLAERGWSPAALSYGYGGLLHGKLGVVSDRDGVKLAADLAGDEPMMLANSLPGVPVVVGKHRHISGRTAVQDLGANVLVLDDGFQVWKLHRDLDIVLVNADNPFDNGRMLPAGKLREPLRALERAHCVIATGDTDISARSGLSARLHQLTDAPVFFGGFVPSGLISLTDKTEQPVQSLHGRKVFAFSSIANPTRFHRTLTDAGADICADEQFADHHYYWAEDIAWINRKALESDAEIIVTTDKDAVKLEDHDLALPAYALRIRLELEDEDGFWKLAESRIGAHANQG